MTRFRLPVPVTLIAGGAILVLGVIGTNAVHQVIEHGDGIRHPHNFSSHGLRAVLGGVVILGLLLIISGIVWSLATKRERRRTRDLNGEP